MTVDEIITPVNIADGGTAVAACPAADPGHTGQVTIDQIIVAVNNALTGCRPPAGGRG